MQSEKITLKWEKITANETAYKGLISKYKSNSNNSIPEKQTANQKVAKRPKHIFLQRRHTDG